MKIINIILPLKVNRKFIQAYDFRISRNEYFLQKRKIQLIQIISVYTILALVAHHNLLKRCKS